MSVPVPDAGTGGAGFPGILVTKRKGTEMSIKLKALGLGLLATMAMSAFAVMNASASSTGHFVSHAKEHHLIVTGTDAFGTAHQLVFKEGTGTGISCTHSTYHGTLEGLAATTTTALRVRPSYSKCATESGTWGEVTVHVPTACGTNVFEFTSGGTGTVHLNCTITITHPNCEITVPNQTLSGVTYKNVTEGGTAGVTLNVNVGNINGQFHGGICIFLGTNHTFTMTGSATVTGEDTNKNPVGITST